MRIFWLELRRCLWYQGLLFLIAEAATLIGEGLFPINLAGQRWESLQLLMLFVNGFLAALIGSVWYIANRCQRDDRSKPLYTGLRRDR